MFVVRRAGRMATRGAAEHRIVRRVRVARKACYSLMRARRDREPCVIEGRSAPGRGRVARSTSGRESGSDMIRIRGRVVDRLVAAVAIFRRSLVDAIHVARGARNRSVFPSEREGGGAVIEYGTGPLRGAMACFASLREPSCHVVRARRRLELRQVARYAGGGQRRVLVVHVAGSASNGRMFPRQWEPRRRVIERGSQPLGGAVTQRTILREPGGNVIRILRRLILRHVARRASRTQPSELSADVAASARDAGVFPSERELRGRVIEARGHPRGRRVARLAGERQSRVARILRRLVLR